MNSIYGPDLALAFLVLYLFIINISETIYLICSKKNDLTSYNCFLLG